MENIIDRIKLKSTGETYELISRKPEEIELIQNTLETLSSTLEELRKKVDKLYYDAYPEENPNGSGSGSGSGSGIVTP